MKKIIVIAAILFAVLLLAGCSAKISEIKKDDFVGKTVTVSGEVKNTVKLGVLSGYTIADKTGEISIFAKELPKEGKTVTASGVLMKDLIIGYYIKADE
jgi:hypothetical protein